MPAAAHSGWHIASRVGAGIFGAYLFTWGFGALGVTSLLAAGLEFHEATSLVSIVGFLVYLAAFCFAFITARVARAWLVLAGGGASMTLAGWWLSRSLA